MDQNKKLAQKNAADEMAQRDQISQRHAKMMEKQRKYFKLVKEFQEECVKNEKYMNMLERAGMDEV